MVTKKKNLIYNFLKLAPLVLLYISVLNDFDFNFIKYFSFNFPFILIYYWSLKRSESLGYGLIFIAGHHTRHLFLMKMDQKILAQILTILFRKI